MMSPRRNRKTATYNSILLTEQRLGSTWTLSCNGVGFTINGGRTWKYVCDETMGCMCVCVCDNETGSCGQTWGTAHKTETVDLYLNFRQRNCPTVNQSYLFLLNTINAIFCIPNKNRKYFITFLCRKAFWTVYYMSPMFRVFFHKLAESLSLPSACPCFCSDAHIQCFLYDWDKDFVTVTPISFRCCS